MKTIALGLAFAAHATGRGERSTLPRNVGAMLSRRAFHQENSMNSIKTRRILQLASASSLVCLALFGGHAQAAGDVDPHGFNDVKQMIAKMPEMTDKNKDGMISKKEYLEMQGKLFDMKAKKGMMTMDEFKSFMMEFKTFGQ
jgi:hypothetical protein